MAKNKKVFIRILCLTLCLSFIVPLVTACKDKNDDKKEDEAYMKNHDVYLDYTTEYDFGSAYYMLNSGVSAEYTGVGLQISSEHTRGESNFSGLWKNHNSKQSLSFKYYPLDLTSYDSLVMWVYSEVNNGAPFSILIHCQYSEVDAKTSYFRYQSSINWTGWKMLEISLSDFNGAYGSDYSKVSGISITTTGWNMKPDPTSVLYFDSVCWTQRTYQYTFPINEIGDHNYDAIKKNLVSMLTGGVNIKNASSDYKTTLENNITRAKKAQEDMKKDGSLLYDYDMQTTESISSIYYRLRDMAIGYAIEGSDTYKNKQLLADIVYGLEYMHNNYFKDKNLHTYPKRNNWWNWEIGSPQAIVNILMLCGDGLTEEQIDKYLDPVNRYVPYPSMTMANRVDLAYVTIAASALQKDAIRLLISRNALDECIEYVSQGDGFYTDGSFLQHDHIPYTGSYGPIMLEAMSKLILSSSDTCFRFKSEIINGQYWWATESFMPLMYHGAFFGLVRGRSIYRSSTDVSLGVSAISGMLRMTKYATKEQSDYLKSAIKEYYAYNGVYYRKAFGPFDLKILDEIIADETIAERTDFEFAKVFAKMDRPIAQLFKYGVGISLSSSRIAKYEAINEENGKGWYTGDGMLYIYTTVNDYDAQYWANVNMYRLPGTTVTTAARVESNISSGNTLSKYDFVGGVTLGHSMVSAMQFESATDKMKSLNDHNKFVSTLTGKKAWFVFDNEIVCLGTDIKCSDAYDTETIIENRRLAQNQKFYANGLEVTQSNGTLTDASSLWIENFGGVYIPNNTPVSYKRTSGSVSFLELYINHGKNITASTYSYILLPTMSLADTTAYSQNPNSEILSNTSAIQAVRDNSTNTTGYIFWSTGSFDNVSVSAPCTVLVKRVGNDITVSVADPTQKLSSLTVTVDGNVKTVEVSGGATVTYLFSK